MPITLLALQMFCGVFDTQAQSIRPQLNSTMNYVDVLRLWGKPVEKSEAEAKRDETWLYVGGKVIFHEGKVSAWVDDATIIQEALAEQEDTTKHAAAPKHGEPDDQAIEAILEDILKEPNDDTTTTIGGGVPNMPTSPPNIGSLMGRANTN